MINNKFNIIAWRIILLSALAPLNTLHSQGSEGCDLAALGNREVAKIVKEASSPSSEIHLGYTPKLKIRDNVFTINYVIMINGGGQSYYPDCEAWICINKKIIDVTKLIPKIQIKTEALVRGPILLPHGKNLISVEYHIWNDNDPNCCASRKNVIIVEYKNNHMEIISSKIIKNK